MSFVSFQAVQAVHDQRSFISFLREHLSWPIQDDLTFEDLSYSWQPEEIGLKAEDLKGSSITQLKPFVENQPWGIFFIHLSSKKLFVTDLRKIIRGLNPGKRTLKNYPTWRPQHLLFICTPDWKDYTFAHFDGEKPEKAKLSLFGWEYQSDFVRTLCEFNIRQLIYPQAMDMFGLDPGVWLQQWASAFDVKRVTDKFYEEYDSIFRSMKKILSKHFGVSSKLYDKKPDDWTLKDEKADRPVHLFVQNLVNRLMFLKFLEKRRWLDFNPNYLANLYKNAKAENKNFYEEYLFYVFFAGLNRQVQWIGLQGENPTNQAQMFQDRIGVLPFLNGGLFEKEPVDEKIKIPNEAFTELFDLFSRYNFTVNEDTPLDIEVAVNPEMLGKVFEESVIARKEKGAYYTPRNIVSFMCREALKNHLVQHTAISDVVKKVEKLIDEHSADLLESHDALELYKSLANIKVLDPAVGSGAFPVGMMFEILECYRVIGAKLEKDHPFLVQNKLANPHEVYLLKKQIIQNNLYGVDIEEFAVNIARLRFWLSLAVDFPIEFGTREEFITDVHKIEPLPNLLYKIKQGDSLLAKYHNVSLEPHGRLASGEFALGRKSRIVSAIDGITKLKSEFFTESNSTKKKKFQSDIESLLRALVAKEIDVEIASLREASSQADLFGVTKKQKQEQKAVFDQIENLEKIKKVLIESDALPQNFPVIWDVDFGDVLGSGGFDVVIANPPYVRQEEFKELKEDLALQYECYTGTSDLYTYFYERGIRLLKTGGTLTYISSNKYFRAGYGEKLRGYLTHNMKIHALIDFGDAPVFKAIAYPSVIVATKQKGVLAEEQFRALTITSEEQLDRFEETFRADAIAMQQSDLSVDGWHIENRNVLDLLEKIKHVGVPLEEYVGGKIYYGIKTGYNEAFVINDDTRKQLIKEDKKSAEVIKPFLRGRDIKRYAIEDPGLWLLFIPWHFPLHEKANIEGASKEAEKEFKKQYPAVYRHLLQYKTKLETRNEAETGVRYEWYALQRCAASYWQELQKPKIVWGNLGEVASFAFTNETYYASAPACIIPIKDLYLLAVLNSKVGDYFFHKTAAVRQGGYLEYKPMYVSKLPVVSAKEFEKNLISNLVEVVLDLKKEKEKKFHSHATPEQITSFFEEVIDGCVYELYFRDHMMERELNIIDDLKNEMADWSSIRSTKDRLQEAVKLYDKLQERHHPIRNKLLLMATKSPEVILPIIQGTTP